MHFEMHPIRSGEHTVELTCSTNKWDHSAGSYETTAAAPSPAAKKAQVALSLTSRHTVEPREASFRTSCSNPLIATRKASRLKVGWGVPRRAAGEAPCRTQRVRQRARQRAYNY